MKHTLFDWQAVRTTIREQRFGFFVGYVFAIMFGVIIWWVWDQFSDPEQFPARVLWIADGLILLNLILCAGTLRRERLAGLLLLGATLVFEILLMTFLYQI